MKPNTAAQLFNEANANAEKLQNTEESECASKKKKRL